MKQKFLLLLALTLYVPFAVADDCKSIAKLIAIQGRVELQSLNDGRWHQAKVGQTICKGQSLHTSILSRAVVLLSDKTTLNVDEKTTLTFDDIRPLGKSVIRLIFGELFFKSRTVAQLGVHAPFINTAIRGTEFLVKSDANQSQVTVFEGQVESSNELGSVILNGKETASAQKGQAPVKKIETDLNGSVRWALYYPLLLDAQNLKRNASLAPVIDRYRSGDALGALEALDSIDAPLVKAALLMNMGRSDAAKAMLEPNLDQADAQALMAIMSLSLNDKTKALALAQNAADLDSNSVLAWVALSYANQARLDLDAALENIQKAIELSPENGLAYSRLAEIYASNQNQAEALQAAARATELDPLLAGPWTIKGFAALNLGRTAESLDYFKKAITLDPADPLARFGLGIAKISQGDSVAGSEDIEISAALDPNDSMIRSYLGKAYYQQGRNKITATQLKLAKNLDPKDPTPWFFDAIMKQTENKPVEALVDMEKAMELNDNRAVYRSRQMLDSDKAAKNASIGRIYNDLGFNERALLEAWKAEEEDPAEYAGHRLLADSYAALPNHELARISEVLQAQLLQPLTRTSVQPSLAERNLAIVPNSGPSKQSFNEFTPMFFKNGFGLQTSAVVGSFNTYGDEVVHSGIWKDFAYSLGQFHHETDGFRANNRVEQDIFNGLVQFRITPDLTMQAEYRHKDMKNGDLNYRYDLNFFDPYYKRHLQTDTFRGGLNYQIDPHQKLIVSGIVHDGIENLTVKSFLDGFPFFLPSMLNLNQPSRGYLLEASYLFDSRYLDLNVGGGYHENKLHRDVPRVFNFLGLSQPETNNTAGNAYVYSYIHPFKGLNLTLGGSAVSFQDEYYAKNFTSLNPKLGITWAITPSSTLRAAAFKNFKRNLPTDQTIEPTQIAGFNQLFDDFAGTQAWRYGLGLDHKLTKTLLAGVELSRRDREVLNLNSTGKFFNYNSDRETLYRSYLSWAPLSQFALDFAYQLEVFDGHNKNFIYTPDTRTHLAPLTLSYFHDSGFMAKVTATYLNQTVSYNAKRLPEVGYETALLDTGIGYRLPKNHGLVSFSVNNLFNQNFFYQGAYYRTPHEERPMFYPERNFMGKISVVF